MYEVNFELNNQSIDVNLELQQNSINADLILNVLPDKTSQLINDSGFITMSALLPLQADILDLQNSKVDKVTGKGLSTNDFTNAYKTKLEGIEAGAEVNKVSSVNGQIGDVVIEIPDSATWGNITGTLSNQTDLQTALNGKQGKLTATYGLTLNGDVISGKEITDVVDGISAVIPAQATEQNQLADKNFVNSSIATNTANFIGTFDSVAELEAYSGTVTNNDYAFVVGTDADGNTVYDRYKYNADEQEWLFEYELNNSSFTADQWASINSGITSGDVSLINTALQPNDNITQLVNNAGYITGINSSDVTTALGYTPYNSTNPAGYITNSALSGYATETWVGNQGYITGINSTDVTTALGYTPYDSSNPSGYTSNVGTVTSVNSISPTNGDVTLTASDVGAQPAGNYVTTNTTQTISGVKTYTGAVHFIGSGDTNAVFISTNTRFNVEGTTKTVLGFGNNTFYINHNSYELQLRGSGTRPKYNSSSYLALTSDIPDDTSDLTNGAGFITGITSSDVTTALGYTPVQYAMVIEDFTV